MELYYWRVRAKDSHNGYSAYSSKKYFGYLGPVNIVDYRIGKPFSEYMKVMNPDGKIQLQYKQPGNKKMRIHVYTVKGKPVETERFFKPAENVEVITNKTPLKPGIYLVEIKGGGQSELLRVLIVK
jgi:hypothetical protein